MGRIRTIKPEFWKHEDLSGLPEATHMLAAALLNYADDEGYFNANLGLIKAECSPLREPSVSVQDSIVLLVSVGYIRTGVGADGRHYGQVVKFDDHQRVNRPTPSKIKGLDIVWDGSPRTHPQLSEPSPPEGNREGKGKEEEPNGSLSAGAATPNCPHDEIIALYHELLPANPRIKVWDGERAKALRSRWREDPKRQSLDYWRRFFGYVAQSAFLTGQRDGGNGRAFTPGLDWLVKASNFAKVIEARYHEGEAA